MNNPVIDTLMNRKSIRSFTDRIPSDEDIELIVRAGQQAPFAYQMGSLLLSRDRERIPYRAPLYFIPCIDSHRHEKIMERRGWKLVQNDLLLLLFGIQDATLMVENMIIAAESLGMGSCLIGSVPYYADKIADRFNLPPRVFPLVGLSLGFPDEDPPPRPRYPLEITLYEGKYPEFNEEDIVRAMKIMDDGYLAQDYYRRLGAMIRLEDGRSETYSYDTYSWTEHISRKTGQWEPLPDDLLDQFTARGFSIPGYTPGEENQG